LPFARPRAGGFHVGAGAMFQKPKRGPLSGARDASRLRRNIAMK